MSSPLPTPPHCIADFCLIPLGTPTASVAREIASVQRLLKTSGLSYTLHSAGTTVEGSWDDVMRVIGQCHEMLHREGVVRIQSDVRVGTRVDRVQGMGEKVERVERLLAEGEDASREG
ncbi:hypothetical protein EJ04DRAFT_570472 [Polyplosphaeria fusca]|uniref:Thiamine-binding protein domain-containing protein n=1 Tax=Polyplosphaeria fusca TaxID=682080 RepID=A0A9P4QM83_9PLEO|nr:hypothetical protein EJ04DRAFT_570472 [Polyplosphaeria fusca]